MPRQSTKKAYFMASGSISPLAETKQNQSENRQEQNLRRQWENEELFSAIMESLLLSCTAKTSVFRPNIFKLLMDLWLNSSLMLLEHFRNQAKKTQKEQQQKTWANRVFNLTATNALLPKLCRTMSK